MTTQSLMTSLSTLSPHRENRLQLTQQVIENGDIENLFAICLKVESPYHTKAWWILEWVLASDREYLLTYGPLIVRKMTLIKEESALRPMVKILCSWTKSQIKNDAIAIPQQDMDTMIESGFDWLITDVQVAIKVHAMEMLSLIMKWNDWIIHPLADVLSKGIQEHSPAYKARASKILKKIKKQI
ncbi:hypothetical protein [Membranihabitans marinus]|uniref:hypothetical protein n=1 Tax=Membranihabitans marinus TaxID=1227546 RepID=UPI001F218193|nr:hypothetical protein [Membranihabitans marinus]